MATATDDWDIRISSPDPIAAGSVGVIYKIDAKKDKTGTVKCHQLPYCVVKMMTEDAADTEKKEMDAVSAQIVEDWDRNMILTQVYKVPIGRIKGLNAPPRAGYNTGLVYYNAGDDLFKLLIEDRSLKLDNHLILYLSNLLLFIARLTYKYQLIHHDLKCENITFTRERGFKVIDWGFMCSMKKMIANFDLDEKDRGQAKYTLLQNILPYGVTSGMYYYTVKNMILSGKSKEEIKLEVARYSADYKNFLSRSRMAPLYDAFGTRAEKFVETGAGGWWNDYYNEIETLVSRVVADPGTELRVWEYFILTRIDTINIAFVVLDIITELASSRVIEMDAGNRVICGSITSGFLRGDTTETGSIRDLYRIFTEWAVHNVKDLPVESLEWLMNTEKLIDQLVGDEELKLPYYVDHRELLSHEMANKSVRKSDRSKREREDDEGETKDAAGEEVKNTTVTAATATANVQKREKKKTTGTGDSDGDVDMDDKRKTQMALAASLLRMGQSQSDKK